MLESQIPRFTGKGRAESTTNSIDGGQVTTRQTHSRQRIQPVITPPEPIGQQACPPSKSTCLATTRDGPIPESLNSTRK